jgi:hypothetical protein
LGGTSEEESIAAGHGSSKLPAPTVYPPMTKHVADSHSVITGFYKIDGDLIRMKHQSRRCVVI